MRRSASSCGREKRETSAPEVAREKRMAATEVAFEMRMRRSASAVAFERKRRKLASKGAGERKRRR